MRKALTVLAALLTLFTPAFAADWIAIVDKVDKATVYIEGEKGLCSGFVIDENRRYVLTAAHCDQKDIFIDKLTAKLIAKDVKADMAVFEVKDLDRPMLVVAKDNPKRGQEVMSFGYGYGLERPMLRVTHISDDEGEIPELSGRWILTDATFVSGQSGGPIVNAAGEVVAIVQMGSPTVGLGKGAKDIRKYMGRFLGTPKKAG